MVVLVKKQKTNNKNYNWNPKINLYQSIKNIEYL